VNIDPDRIDDDELLLEMNRELAEVSQDDLAQMAETRPAVPAPDEKGRVRGTIVEIKGPDVYVDLGGKSEAFIPLDEFDPHQAPAKGDVFSFVMHGFDSESGLMRLSMREVRLDADLDSLHAGDVVEGRVTGLNVGGLELTVGSVRGFMPKSQVSLDRIEDFAPFLGRRLECEVTEINRKGHNLVLSHRRILEKQRLEMREKVKYALAEGQTRTGVVRRLTDFGAFVDLGGLDGLLHVSDMSWARVHHPKEVVKVGETIEVQVLKIDLVKDRISLGLKQLAPDPWNVVAGNYREGETVNGKVVKLMNFGAFVELEPGVEALIPVSEMSWSKRIHHPKEMLAEGDSVRCAVLSVDVEQHRISLSLKQLAEDPWKDVATRYAADSVVSGRVMRLAEFGAFVQLEEGVEGLVHISEMSDKRIRTPGDVVKEGDVIQVRVKSVDAAQRRISLSMRIAKPDDHAAAASSDGPAQPPKPRKRKRPLKGGLD